jgi:hypothetical protein
MIVFMKEYCGICIPTSISLNLRCVDFVYDTTVHFYNIVSSDFVVFERKPNSQVVVGNERTVIIANVTKYIELYKNTNLTYSIGNN